jgi:hypothetical protein
MRESCLFDSLPRRCREVARWLKAAAECGVNVASWVVIDDDDLLQVGHRAPTPRRSLRSTSASSPIESQSSPPALRAHAHAPPPAAAVPPVSYAYNAAEDDYGWEFSF